ncbi:MAG: ArnT family glycosyltransferase [Verrucomicrobiales bacterium]
MLPRPLLIGLVILTALRWVVAGATELTPAEALVWLGGREAGMGYFGHGPVASWLSRVGTWVAGDTAIGVRLFAPLAVFGASWLAWRLASSAFGEKAGGWFFVALQLTPLVNLAAVRALPETYLFFFGVAGAWWLWQALHRASRWVWQWLAAGLVFGVGVLSAPAGVALVAGMVTLLVVPRRWRGRWRSPGPWLAMICAAAGAAPWVWWLRDQAWLPLVGVRYDWARGLDPWAGLRWIGLGVLAASPFLFAGMVWSGARAAQAAWRSWRRYREGGLSRDDPWDQKNGRVFLLSLAMPSALWMVVEAITGGGGLGAAALVGSAALMMLAAVWVESPLAPTAHRLAQNASLLVAGGYSLLALHSDMARHLGVPWSYRMDPTSEIRGWKESTAQTAAALRTIATAQGASQQAFLIAESPGLAAIHEFYMTGDGPFPHASVTRIRCHVPARHAVDSDFSVWVSYADETSWTGLDALFVSESAEPELLEVLSRQFDRLESLGRIEVRRGRWPVRRLSFFACRSWRGPARSP